MTGNLAPVLRSLQKRRPFGMRLRESLPSLVRELVGLHLASKRALLVVELSHEPTQGGILQEYSKVERMK